MSDSLTTLADLITQPNFLIGLVSGTVALMVLFITPRDAASTAPAWGVCLAAASAAAVNVAIGRNFSLLAGLGLLALGGWLLDASESRENTVLLMSTGWVVLALGAIVIALRTGLSEVAWIRFGAPAIGLMAGAALRTPTHLVANPPRGRAAQGEVGEWEIPSQIVGSMVAITAFGIWTTVPDTEAARVVLGASLPMALGTLPFVNGRLAGIGTFSLFTTLAWVASVGGESRPASVIGGWACLGLLALAPFAASRLPSDPRSRRLAPLALHATMVLVAARVIGLWESAFPALIAVAALAFAGSLALGFLIQREPRAGT